MAGHKDEWETARKVGGEILKKNHGEKVGEKNILRTITDTEMKLKLLRLREGVRRGQTQGRNNKAS